MVTAHTQLQRRHHDPQGTDNRGALSGMTVAMRRQGKQHMRALNSRDRHID